MAQLSRITSTKQHKFFFFTVFTNQDGEKDNESLPIATTKIPLTLIQQSTGVGGQHHKIDHRHKESGAVETFFVGITTNISHQDVNAIDYTKSFNVKPICFDFPNKSENGEWRPQMQLQQIHSVYDNYGNLNLEKSETNEFVGVGRLDILQGVSEGKK